MKIGYTTHAKEKFEDLRKLGLHFKTSDIQAALENPDHKYYDNKKEAHVALKRINDRLNLKVVYVQFGDIITVITFHPTRKGRYERF